MTKEAIHYKLQTVVCRPYALETLINHVTRNYVTILKRILSAISNYNCAVHESLWETFTIIMTDVR